MQCILLKTNSPVFILVADSVRLALVDLIDALGFESCHIVSVK